MKKRQKLTQAKYIGLLASMPNGLKIRSLFLLDGTATVRAVAVPDPV